MKTKPQHTPGPWKYDGAGFGNIRPVKETGRNIVYFGRAEGSEEFKERDANARLIAAAPDLLEACKLALERLRPGNIRKDFSGHVAYAALGAAIHKAEGKL